MCLPRWLMTLLVTAGLWFASPATGQAEPQIYLIYAVPVQPLIIYSGQVIHRDCRGQIVPSPAQPPNYLYQGRRPYRGGVPQSVMPVYVTPQFGQPSYPSFYGQPNPAFMPTPMR